MACCLEGNQGCQRRVVSWSTQHARDTLPTSGEQTLPKRFPFPSLPPKQAHTSSPREPPAATCGQPQVGSREPLQLFPTLLSTAPPCCSRVCCWGCMAQPQHMGLQTPRWKGGGRAGWHTPGSSPDPDPRGAPLEGGNRGSPQGLSVKTGPRRAWTNHSENSVSCLRCFYNKIIPKTQPHTARSSVDKLRIPDTSRQQPSPQLKLTVNASVIPVTLVLFTRTFSPQPSVSLVPKVKLEIRTVWAGLTNPVTCSAA